jgi:probable HAF family extracellular repeat protein
VKTTRILAGPLLTLLCLGLVTPRIAADPITYSLTNLSQRTPIGINDQGQVGLGASYPAHGWWSGNGTFAQPGNYPDTVNIYNSLGSNAGTLTAVNPSGAIPGGNNGSTVPWVNDNGGSTGISYQYTPSAIATAYVNTGGGQQPLDTAILNNSGGTWIEPGAINNAGQVVGGASFPNTGPYQAFLYSGGQLTNLGTLGGQYSLATAINNSGVVVGWSAVPGSIGATMTHAFVYQNGTMTDLTPLLGGNWSAAFGINSAGVIVGEMSSGSSGLWHAFMLDNGKVTDLNSLLPAGLGWTLQAATAINNLGQIIGYGTDPEGNESTFLLTPSSLGAPLDPVPEPASIFCALGILAAALVRQKMIARGRRQPSTAL